MIERRQFGRRTVFKPAIVIQEGREDIRCAIVDISLGGARIQSSDVANLPLTLRLLIPDDDVYYDCRLVHRQDNTAGVEFLTVPRKLSRWRAREARKVAELDALACIRAPVEVD